MVIAVVISTSCLLPAGSAMASSALPAGAPTNEMGFLCANGGNGLCLQQNGELDSLVANDNKIADMPFKQQWEFIQFSTTDSSYPFGTPALNGDVTAGRRVGIWEANGSAPGTMLCLAWATGDFWLHDCIGQDGRPSTGTLFVLSGSGRMISVLDSNDNKALAFINSDQLNGSNPIGSSNDNCPASCWGPNAG
jgi:hypothetical protein